MAALALNYNTEALPSSVVSVLHVDGSSVKLAIIRIQRPDRL